MSDTLLISWWESKLARRLELLVGALAMVIVCRVAFDENISWLAWACGGAVAVLACVTRWPYGALFVLIGASAMPRVAVELFGWNARPEHFAAAIVALCVGIWLIYGKRAGRLEKLDYWIAAYVAINYISSAFGSSEPSTTLRWALQNNLAVLPYFLIRVLVQDLKTLRSAVRILIGVGVAEATYGIACYASHRAFGTAGGVEIAAYLGTIAPPYGTMYEPNLFGAYTAACAVLVLPLYFGESRHRFATLIAFLVVSLATVLSFSRAALFALIVVSCLVLWFAGRPETKRRSKVAILILAFGLALTIATTAVGGVLRERITNLFSEGLTEQTALGRFLVFQEALQDVPRHALLGTGTASFNLSFDWARYIPDWSSDKTWIGNAPLRILHDVGLIGLTAFLGFLITLCMRIRRSLRGANGQVPMLLGLSAGCLLYAISFQLTDGTILAFFWVQLGFLGTAAILIDNRTFGDGMTKPEVN